MPQFLVVLFWCWFAVSCAILLRRGFRKATGTRSARPASGAGVPVTWPTIDEVAPAPVDAGASAVVARPTPSTRTIVEALDGIQLPCELTPLAAPESGIDFTRRAAFYTVGYPADAVAPEVADELERIGMAFNALSDHVAIATREDVRVRVAVRAVGASANGIADLDYPTAPEHSVVVEFELA